MPRLLRVIQDTYVVDYGLLMAAVLVYTLPIVIVFITQQKRFVAGILGSVKG